MQKAIMFMLSFLIIFSMASFAIANTGAPGVITSATYNNGTGVLDISGTYVNAPCDKRLVGFALFINGSNPKHPDGGSLDGNGTNTMHLVSNSSCAVNGTWSDTHVLTTAPGKVCVVIYDVHTDKGIPKKNELIPAGKNYNGDNSYDKNHPEKSYNNSACIVPEIINTPIVPEFGLIAGLATIVGALTFFFFVRRN